MLQVKLSFVLRLLNVSWNGLQSFLYTVSYYAGGSNYYWYNHIIIVIVIQLRS